MSKSGGIDSAPPSRIDGRGERLTVSARLGIYVGFTVKMSHETTEPEGQATDSDSPEQIPESVLRGIKDIEEGRTASKEDLIEASLREPE